MIDIEAAIHRVIERCHEQNNAGPDKFGFVTPGVSAEDAMVMLAEEIAKQKEDAALVEAMTRKCFLDELVNNPVKNL